MGFLDEYGFGEDDVKTPTFERKLPAAGTHNFEIGEAVVKKGTKNQPNNVSALITYQLSDADGDPTGAAEEWFLMREDGKVTERVQEKLGWLDLRAKSLGFEGGINDPEFSMDNLIGLTGRIEIVHNKSGERTFANVRNVTVDTPDSGADDNEFAAAPAPKAKKSKAEAKPSGDTDAEMWK